MPEPHYSERVLAEARLASVRGVGPLTRQRLVEAFGSADGVFRAATRDLAAVRGVGPKTAAAIGAAPSAEAIDAMLRDAAERGIGVLTDESDAYPASLRQIHDPPPILYCRGEVLAQDARAVAIVGTRRATRYGLAQAARLAAGLAEAGVTVVSGLARGVDGAAHHAALEAGGRTLASLAGGLNRIYPPEHAKLADRVAAQGALLAEAPPPMPPMSGAFPQRNRIISGLSLGVVVIEAAERSGALITARHAAEQGRDAFAVPGPVDSPQSRGCHRLLQEGAKLVTCVEDILEELSEYAHVMPSRAAAAKGGAPPAEAPAPAKPQRDWGEPERSVLGAIDREATSVDRVVEATGLPVEQVLVGLSRLELAGEIRRLSGVSVCKA